MPTTLPKKAVAGRTRYTSNADCQRSPLLATCWLALTFAIASGSVPSDIVLPVMSGVVIFSGLLVGGWALLIGCIRGASNDRTFDTAGILVLFGCVMAVVCDKSDFLRSFGALPGL